MKSGTKVGNEFLRVVKSCPPGFINTELGKMLACKVRAEILQSHGDEHVRKFNELLNQYA